MKWIPFAFCADNGFWGWLIVTLLAYYKYSWFLLAGIAQNSQKLWLTFLVLYGQLEELFFHWILSHSFPENRPPCSLVFDPVFESARDRGMPSVEVQLSFSLSVFIILHFVIANAYPSLFVLLIVTLLPWVVAGGMYVTSNNTATQILVGAFVGTANAVKRVCLYHYFVRDMLIALFARYPWMHNFIPTDAT
jgi:hypothetical protein